MELVPVVLVLLLLLTLLVAENRPGARWTQVDSSLDEQPRDAEWGLNEGGEGDLTIIGSADGNLHAVNAENEEV